MHTVTWVRLTPKSEIEREALAIVSARDADKHHPVVTLGLGEKRIAVIHLATEHPCPTGAAEALPAGVRCRHPVTL